MEKMRKRSRLIRERLKRPECYRGDDCESLIRSRNEKFHAENNTLSCCVIARSKSACSPDCDVYKKGCTERKHLAD